jgi:hypothetical protein
LTRDAAVNYGFFVHIYEFFYAGESNKKQNPRDLLAGNTAGAVVEPTANPVGRMLVEAFAQGAAAVYAI